MLSKYLLLLHYPVILLFVCHIPWCLPFAVRAKARFRLSVTSRKYWTAHGRTKQFFFVFICPSSPTFCCALHVMWERKVCAVPMYYLLPKLINLSCLEAPVTMRLKREAQFISNNVLGFYANTWFYYCTNSGCAVTFHVEEENFLETFWKPKASTSMDLHGLGCAGGFSSFLVCIALKM